MPVTTKLDLQNFTNTITGALDKVGASIKERGRIRSVQQALNNFNPESGENAYQTIMNLTNLGEGNLAKIVSGQYDNIVAQKEAQSTESKRDATNKVDYNALVRTGSPFVQKSEKVQTGTDLFGKPMYEMKAVGEPDTYNPLATYPIASTKGINSNDKNKFHTKIANYNNEVHLITTDDQGNEKDVLLGAANNLTHVSVNSSTVTSTGYDKIQDENGNWYAMNKQNPKQVYKITGDNGEQIKGKNNPIDEMIRKAIQ